ncbi:hypothetical protein ACFOWE_07650 [Planomonospora corallina]|uniref:Pentapeptide repeat-containing protein n=1 Tax=Planomonospora corallina TaxID=1806052 RepID=A0ABV8I533_9ACTN
MLTGTALTGTELTGTALTGTELTGTAPASAVPPCADGLRRRGRDEPHGLRRIRRRRAGPAVRISPPPDGPAAHGR